MEEKSKGSHEAGHHEIHGELKIDNNPDQMVSKFGTKMKRNPWIPVSFILGIVVIILLVISIRGSGLTGNAVGASTAEKNVLDFASSQGLNATIVNSTESGPFYEIYISIQGQTFPVYVTKDGKNMATSLIPLTATLNATPGNSNTATNTPPANVPKTAKPKVDAYVFAYCPYGLQFEKALFPVYDLLKNKADINIVYIGAMHGEFEHVESLRQIAILNLYGKDKLFAYLKEFDTNTDIGSCSGDAACLDKYLPAIYTKLSIDKAKVNAYMNSSSEKIYQANEAQASKLGISGSPTFAINDVEVQVDRTPSAIEKVVCNAFTTAPSDCSKNLSASAMSPGFGATAGASTGASCN